MILQQNFQQIYLSVCEILHNEKCWILPTMTSKQNWARHSIILNVNSYSWREVTLSHQRKFSPFQWRQRKKKFFLTIFNKQNLDLVYSETPCICDWISGLGCYFQVRKMFLLHCLPWKLDLTFKEQPRFFLVLKITAHFKHDWCAEKLPC